MNYNVFDVDIAFHYEDLRVFIPVVGALFLSLIHI